MSKEINHPRDLEGVGKCDKVPAETPYTSAVPSGELPWNQDPRVESSRVPSKSVRHSSRGLWVFDDFRCLQHKKRRPTVERMDRRGHSHPGQSGLGKALPGGKFDDGRGGLGVVFSTGRGDGLYALDADLLLAVDGEQHFAGPVIRNRKARELSDFEY